MKLCAITLAITVAIFWGFYLFVATLLEMWNITFFGFNSNTFRVIALFYPGITPSFTGAIIGLIYGLVCGVICGGLFALLHNWIANLSCKIYKK